MADIPAVEWLYEPIDNCEGHIHTKNRIFFKDFVLCCTTSMKLPHEVWRSYKSRVSQHPLSFVCPLSGHSNVKLDRVNLPCVICHVVQPIFRKCFKENWFFTKSVEKSQAIPLRIRKGQEQLHAARWGTTTLPGRTHRSFSFRNGFNPEAGKSDWLTYPTSHSTELNWQWFWHVTIYIYSLMYTSVFLLIYLNLFYWFLLWLALLLFFIINFYR